MGAGKAQGQQAHAALPASLEVEQHSILQHEFTNTSRLPEELQFSQTSRFRASREQRETPYSPLIYFRLRSRQLKWKKASVLLPEGESVCLLARDFRASMLWPGG